MLICLLNGSLKAIRTSEPSRFSWPKTARRKLSPFICNRPWKYLKGFLLASGWNLRRIHDLEILLQEVIARDADFAAFLPSCQRITEYYIESRYPVGFGTPIQPTTLAEDLQTLYALITLIRKKVTS